MKYSIKNFRQDFPDDKTCLAFIFKHRYPKGLQNIDATKQHYTDLIKSAQDVLNNPRRKKALDAGRLSHLESLVQSLQFLNSVSF